MILTRLRDETRPDHEAVERRFALAERVRSADDYRRLLERFLGFYAVAEARLAAAADWPALGFDFDARRKTPRLVADLLALGGDPAAAPPCSGVPTYDTVPDALGGLYVLEGATLGGQFVARHLSATLPAEAGRAVAFFRSYGPDVGRMWKAFGEFLTGRVDPTDEDRVVASARRTFAAFGDWLGDRPV